MLDAARASGSPRAGGRRVGRERATSTRISTGARVFVVGGENGGIPPEVLARCDERIRVPMAGFIPCYNLQAAVSAVAVERLRQLAVRRRAMAAP